MWTQKTLFKTLYIIINYKTHHLRLVLRKTFLDVEEDEELNTPQRSRSAGQFIDTNGGEVTSNGDAHSNWCSG